MIQDMLQNTFKHFRLILAALFFMGFSGQAFASDPEAVVLLRGISDKILRDLKTNKATMRNNPKVVTRIVNRHLLPHVDERGMARSVVGRVEWTRSDAATQKAFTREFIKLVVKTYSNALASYSDESVRFLPFRTDVSQKSRLKIKTLIIQRGGPSIPVDYRVIRTKRGWKIYDFSVDGISVLHSYRAQFRDALNRGGLSNLLKTVRKHNRKHGT